MSYRLIHTLPSDTRNAQHFDARILARTVSIPRYLVQDILNGPGRERPAVPSEPLFCYSVLRLRGEDMHVLSSARRASTDGALTAHHLVLRGEEVTRVAREDARATPAGVALLLELQHFWASEQRGESDLLPEGNAELPGVCPTAESCATWQVLSGSAENAKILLREPYDRGCVIGVPSGVRVRDALRLLHESDALSPRLGWGNEFAVYCTEQRLPDARQRIVCAVDAPSLSLARQAGIATLRVLPGLKVQSAAPPREAREREHAERGLQGASPVPEPQPASASPVASLPKSPVYYFAECPPEGLFAPSVEAAEKRHLRAKAVYVTVACLLSLVAPVIFLILGEKRDDPAPHTELPLPGQEPPPLPAPSVSSSLPSLPLDEEEEADSSTISGAEAHPIPPVPDRRTSAAPSPDVRDLPHPPDEVSPPSVVSPPVADVASESDSGEANAPSAAPGDDVGDRGSVLSRKPPQVVLIGRALPTALIPKDSAVVERGEYILNYRSGSQSDGSYTRLSIPLQPGKTVLQLRRSAPGSIRATVMNGSAPMPGVPVLNFSVQGNGKLSSVSAKGHPAVAQLPCPTDDGSLEYALLVSKLQVRLQTTGYREPPLPAAQLNIQSESYIDSEQNGTQLKWKPAKERAKMLNNQTGQLLPSASLHLPDFGYNNEPKIKGLPEFTAHLSKRDNHFVWSVSRRFLFLPAVRSAVLHFADPDSGARKHRRESLSPARLYPLLCQLNEESQRERREQLVDAYLRFFKNVDNIRYAREVLLSECPDLVPVSDGVNAKQRELLLRRESGERLLRALRNCLTRCICNAYESRRQELMNDLPTLELVLVEVALKNNELIWTFELSLTS